MTLEKGEESTVVRSQENGKIVTMEPIIQVINKLREVFSAVGTRDAEIQLPQIVVVGAQVIKTICSCLKRTYCSFLSL